jgi:endoglucanase
MRLFSLLSLVVVCAAMACADETASEAIKVDQVGYPSSASKIAVVTAPATSFVVKRTSDNKKVFSGKLSNAVSDADTGDMARTADFSEVKAPGKYYIEIPGVGRSYAFEVGPNVFPRTYYLAMRAFYGQRCGTAVDLGPEFPGFKHAACHTHGSFHPSSGKQGPHDVARGWHDAGDYGRYMPTSGIATGTLLWAWELFGAKTDQINLHIPESGNGTPDILNEARWNLEWMLSMQDDDGGVWHKQTSEQFSGFVMPEDDKLPSVVIGTGAAPYKSTCATADLASVAAIAARVYRKFDPAFAALNLAAAKKAWTWTEQYPNVLFKNPQGVVTGEYGDSNCGDERLWAAAELWRTTGDATYQKYFLDHRAEFMNTLHSQPPENWAQVAPMGLWGYALSGRSDTDRTTVKDIRTAIIAAARDVVSNTQANPYHVSLRTKDYVWGSNGVAANYAVQLLVANEISPDSAFVDAALDDIHYLLGRNTFGLSWVTQVGSNPYRHPHHRPSGADNNAEPWPGLLSGGPNANRQDAVLAKLTDMHPARAYADDQDSYASNEVAINWQASLVFALAGLLR